jgi:hypothetical protein
MGREDGILECPVERINHQPTLAIGDAGGPARAQDRPFFANGLDQSQVFHSQATAVAEMDDQFNTRRFVSLRCRPLRHRRLHAA